MYKAKKVLTGFPAVLVVVFQCIVNVRNTRVSLVSSGAEDPKVRFCKVFHSGGNQGTVQMANMASAVRVGVNTPHYPPLYFQRLIVLDIVHVAVTAVAVKISVCSYIK